jgi:peptidyl-dipeptidase Dcp
MIGSTMLSVNAQGNSDNPLLKKWTGPYGGVPAFNEYNISKSNQPLMLLSRNV